ncbi:MAG: PRC-barrel domain containing protein, partial [Mesorhizobium sp.]
IDVGGFLGIGAKPVAVTASQLDFMRDEDGDVHAVTSWTKDQLKAMPEHRD